MSGTSCQTTNFGAQIQLAVLSITDTKDVTIDKSILLSVCLLVDKALERLYHHGKDRSFRIRTDWPQRKPLINIVPLKGDKCCLSDSYYICMIAPKAGKDCHNEKLVTRSRPRTLYLQVTTLKLLQHNVTAEVRLGAQCQLWHGRSAIGAQRQLWHGWSALGALCNSNIIT